MKPRHNLPAGFLGLALLAPLLALAPPRNPSDGDRPGSPVYTCLARTLIGFFGVFRVKADVLAQRKREREGDDTSGDDRHRMAA